VIYPNQRELNYSYGTSGSTDDVLSRLSAILDHDGSTVLAAYTYLGSGTVIKEDYQQPDVRLNYDPDDDNSLDGFDRFGRIEDQIWAEYDGESSTLDHFHYTYDAAGNRTARQNVLADQAGKDLSETYAYDELYRLIGTDRGHFDAQGNFVKQTDFQDWTLDGLGNFATFNDNGTVQNRTVNAANEIESITGRWVTPEYDRAGNMISAPVPGDETDRVFATYDAWNRLRKVYEDDGDGNFEPSDASEPGPDKLLVTYEFDGTGRRIEKETTEDAPGGERNVDYYFNADWQLLESETVVSGNTSVDQYVWSVTYIDAPVGRWHDDNGDGDFLDYTDDGQANDDWVRYFTRDGNQNVTAAVEGTFDSGSQRWQWQLAERYVYTPYGEATAYDDDWANPAAPTVDGPLYCGYFFDAETATYHVRHRQYHPTLSTWTTRDPLSYSAGDQNLYRYVDNNPTGYVDPHGQAAVPPSAKQRVIPFAPAIKVNSVSWGANMAEQYVFARFVVQFLLPDNVKNLDGWVIQEVRAETTVFTCEGRRLTDESLKPRHFWEAWSLDTIRLRSIVGEHDEFLVKIPGAACTRGTHKVTGRVKGAANWQLPSYFQPGTVKEAGELHSTFRKPANWDAIPGTPHEMIVKWDWCGGTPSIIVETVPISTMSVWWGETIPIYDALQDESIWDKL